MTFREQGVYTGRFAKLGISFLAFCEILRLELGVYAGRFATSSQTAVARGARPCRSLGAGAVGEHRGAEGPLRQFCQFSSVSLHGNPLFFRLILVIFFKMAFPPGEGGHGGEQRGRAKIMDKISKVVRDSKQDVIHT